MRYELNLQAPGFTVKNIDILKVARPKGYRHSYRFGRTKHGFIYIVSGAMRDDFLGNHAESLTLFSGELIFIPKNSEYYGMYLEENTEIKIIQFDLVDGSLPDYLSHPRKINLPNVGELINSFFKPMQNRTLPHPFYSLSCLYELLWQIDEGYSKPPSKYKKLQPALYELSEHFDRSDRIEDYAALCDMSEVSFRRLFREYTGLSPVEYRNDIRLTQARICLQSGEYNVSEAAEHCGFSNLSFFIRLYKKKYGYTPKKE